MSESPDEFHIKRTRDGGFIVMGRSEPGYVREPMFAATTIDEALDYIRKKLAPEPAYRSTHWNFSPDGITRVHPGVPA